MSVLTISSLERMAGTTNRASENEGGNRIAPTQVLASGMIVGGALSAAQKPAA